MCSLLMRLQRSTSLFNFGCFAASWQHAEVNQKALIAAAVQNVKWEPRMKGLLMNRVFRTNSSSWPRATLSARVRQLRNVGRDPRAHRCEAGSHLSYAGNFDCSPELTARITDPNSTAPVQSWGRFVLADSCLPRALWL